MKVFFYMSPFSEEKIKKNEGEGTKGLVGERGPILARNMRDTGHKPKFSVSVSVEYNIVLRLEQETEYLLLLE